MVYSLMLFACISVTFPAKVICRSDHEPFDAFYESETAARADNRTANFELKMFQRYQGQNHDPPHISILRWERQMNCDVEVLQT